MDLELCGKYALVTGGSHGVGLATARSLAAEGCNVAICSRREDRLAEALSQLKSHGVKTLAVPADVLIPADIERVMKKNAQTWKTLHILINNVGGGGRWGSPSVEETEEKVWTDVYNKNAMAAVRFTKLALPLMRKQKWGRVVTVASIQGCEGGGRPWYSMAKSAEISLMKTLAMNPDLARDRITFNTVAPGSVMIPDTGWEEEKKKNPKEFEKTMATFPMGRLGTPEEIANVITFVCSEKASFLNGACIIADGAESRSY